jgi:hypothetical protein
MDTSAKEKPFKKPIKKPTTQKLLFANHALTTSSETQEQVFPTTLFTKNAPINMTTKIPSHAAHSQIQ